MAFTLPPLPYASDALAPHMSEDTLNFHHGKHHQAYITALNSLIEGTDLQDKSLEEIIQNSTGPTFNNAAQTWNHDIFWNSMKPNGGGDIPAKLNEKIVEAFGSKEEFIDAFKKSSLGQFGSGWVWLIQNEDGKLEILKTPNAENPLSEKPSATTLLGVDVWEHSYYLDFQNKRPDYVVSFFENLVDWDAVENRMN